MEKLYIKQKYDAKECCNKAYHVKSSYGVSSVFRLYNWFVKPVIPGSKLKLQLAADELCLSIIRIPGIVAVTQYHINKLHL